MDAFNASFTPSAAILATFRGSPQRVVLPAASKLYRFETLESLLHPYYQRKTSTFESEWWFTQSTFHNLCRAARAAGASLKDAGRSRLAVMEEWNPTMDGKSSRFASLLYYGSGATADSM